MVLVLMALFMAAVAATLAGLVEILFGVAAAAVVTTTPEPLQAAHRRLAEMVALVDRLVVVRQERSHLEEVAAHAPALPPALVALAKSSSPYSLLNHLYSNPNNLVNRL
jgi:hypothetical protein